MTSTAIVDSGPLIASALRSDPDHRASLDALRTPGLRLVIPALCVAEVGYFLERRGGAAAATAFVRGLAGFDVHQPAPDEWERIGELVEEYADLGLGVIDAAVVSLAERLRTELVITLDHRHFGAVRPRHAEAFRLLPD
ncbi:MAG TPA: PIN domain-containing protein [Thermoanaerobaculia bacterium]|nr:PIN domain-containing protein [Thermoanaerobaculia bacterium]